jgi:hypothetical protein
MRRDHSAAEATAFNICTMVLLMAVAPPTLTLASLEPISLRRSSLCLLALLPGASCLSITFACLPVSLCLLALLPGASCLSITFACWPCCQVMQRLGLNPLAAPQPPYRITIVDKAGCPGTDPSQVTRRGGKEIVP